MRGKLLFKAARGNGKSMQAFEMVYGLYAISTLPYTRNNKAIENRLNRFCCEKGVYDHGTRH